MSLPKINSPTYELTVPSTGQNLKFRPFLVKEEKILLIALESIKEETKEVAIATTILNALKSIISNCSMNQIDVNTLTQFDMEYIFLKMRGKSVGEIAEVTYINKSCDFVPEDQHCAIKLKVNLEELKITTPENHTKKFMLTDTIGVVMKYPTPEMFLSVKKDDVDASMKLISKCVDQIFDNENVWLGKDTPEKEMMDFIESLTHDQMEKITNFFDTMPSIQKEIKYTCSKCNKDVNIKLKGLQDFFA